MRLNNKVAIITGGSKGIGKAITSAYIQEGAKVVIAARTITHLEKTTNDIQQLFPNGEIEFFQCDVTSESNIEALCKFTLDKFSSIDIMVNNAGLGGFRPIYGTRLNNWNRMMEINLNSTFLGIKHVWKQMKKQGGGSIINVSSLAGTRAYPMYGAYAASKWGQIGLSKTAAEEGKPVHIRVNVIAPGKVDTSMRENISEDKNKMLTSEDCAGVAVFLASEEAKYITGQIIEIEWFGED
jgi:3-oxoacyl-[acyl-carrier protein] reductase